MTISTAELEVAEVDLRACTDRQRKDLLRALKYAEADPACVCSWWHNPVKRTITYTVVGPVLLVEAVKRAAKPLGA